MAVFAQILSPSTDRLFADEFRIFIKRHLTIPQAFNRDCFQRFLRQLNFELFVGRINLQHHRPTVICSTNIVFVLVDLHGSGGIHPLPKQLAIDRLQPAVWINHRRHWRRSRQVGKCQSGRLIATIPDHDLIVVKGIGIRYLTNVRKRDSIFIT